MENNKVLSINIGLKEVLNGKIETLEKEKSNLEKQLSEYNRKSVIYNTKLSSLRFMNSIAKVLLIISTLALVFGVMLIFIDGEIDIGLTTFGIFSIILIIKIAIGKKINEVTKENSYFGDVNWMRDKIDKINSEILDLEKEKEQLYSKFISKYKEEIIENESDDTIQDIEPQTKECPMCAETIKFKAKICRYCNYKFDN